MKKILAVFVVIIIAVAAGCYGYYAKVVKPQELYAQAEEVFAQKDYDQALDLYSQLGDYEDAKIKADGIAAYKNSIDLMGQGKLKKALKELHKVNQDMELINCDKFIHRCKLYKNMQFDRKALSKRERAKEEKFDRFGYYGNWETTDFVIHVKTTIDEEGTVHIGAYVDENMKAKKDQYVEAGYDRTFERIEWNIDDTEDPDYSIAYSYDMINKTIRISHYAKNDGRMTNQILLYME